MHVSSAFFRWEAELSKGEKEIRTEGLEKEQEESHSNRMKLVPKQILPSTLGGIFLKVSQPGLHGFHTSPAHP